MKTKSLLLLIVVAGVASAAYFLFPTRSIKISGHIEGELNSDSVFIQDKMQNILAVKVDANGDFTFPKFEYQEDIVYRFYDGAEMFNLYLQPGFNLKINLGDIKRWDETLSFSGKGSDENNYLIKKFLLKERTKEYDMNYSEEMENSDLTPESYRSSADTLREMEYNLLDSFPDLPANFKMNQKTNIDLSYFNRMEWYARGKQFKQYVNNEVADYSWGEEYEKERDAMDINNPALIKHGDYLMYMYTYIERGLNSGKYFVGIKDSVDQHEYVKSYFPKQLEYIKSSNLNKKIEDHLSYFTLLNMIGNSQIADKEVEEFKASCGNKEYIDEINRENEKYRAYMASINNNDTTLFEDFEYPMSVFNYLTYRFNIKSSYMDDLEKLPELYLIIKDSVSAPDVRDFLLYNMTKMINNNDWAGKGMVNTAFFEDCKNDKYKKDIEFIIENEGNTNGDMSFVQ